MVFERDSDSSGLADRTTELIFKINSRLRERSTKAPAPTPLTGHGIAKSVSATKTQSSDCYGTAKLANLPEPSLEKTGSDGAVAVRTSFRLMDLPGELQNEIYMHALVLNHPIELWPEAHLQGGDPYRKDSSIHLAENLREVRRDLSPGLLRVSKKFNHETSPIFYGLNTFQFTSLGGWMVLEAFLHTIGSTNRKHIKKLTVSQIWGLERNWMHYRYSDRLPLARLYVILRVKMHLGASWDDPDVPLWPYHGTRYTPLGLDWERDATTETLRVLSEDRSLKNFCIACDSMDVCFSGGLYDFVQEVASKVPGIQVSLHLRVCRMLDETDTNFLSRIEMEWERIQTYDQVRLGLQNGWRVALEIVDDPNDGERPTEHRELLLAE